MLVVKAGAQGAAAVGKDNDAGPKIEAVVPKHGFRIQD
jgi:hypothetical protein